MPRLLRFTYKSKKNCLLHRSNTSVRGYIREIHTTRATLGLLLAKAVPRDAATQPHLGLPPRLPIGVLHVSDTDTALDVHGRGSGVGLAVTSAAGSENGEAVARVDVDGVLAAQADCTATSAVSAYAQEVELCVCCNFSKTENEDDEL